MITLTDNAAARSKELIDAGGRRRRWRCGSPCAPAAARGFSYEMFFDSEIADDDLTADYGGVQVVVDPVERPAPRRRHARLQGRPPGRRVRHQQPERPAHLRLRPVLQLTLPSISPPLVPLSAGGPASTAPTGPLPVAAGGGRLGVAPLGTERPARLTVYRSCTRSRSRPGTPRRGPRRSRQGDP